MGRRGKESKRVGRGRFRAVERGSDESDEDYIVEKDDESDEPEDEYVSFAEDETEDSLCESKEDDEEEEEEEEFVEKKVKKVGRPKSGIQSRKRNTKSSGVVTLGKKKFSSRKKIGNSSDGSDEYDGRERHVFAKPVKRKRTQRRRQKSGNADDPHEYLCGQKNGSLKTRKKSKVSYIEEDSGICDDTDDNDDKEFTPDELDDHVDDEDDDYVDDEDEVIDLKRNKQLGRPCDDTDDNDDKEFTPDELDDHVDDEDDDYVDDEDEVIDLKRNKQLGRPKKQGKRISKGQKRKRQHSDFKKGNRKRPGNKRSMIKSPGYEQVALEQRKVTGGHRRRRNVLDSDSDFEPEYEYTVSEEEREQIREADKLCRDVTATLRRSTPVKKLRRDQDSVHPQMKSIGKKGKEKEDNSKIETGKQVCGICLSEEGKRTVRGALNCCSHYFCFACIMEWSKVESRCPVCKQRFVTISKSAKSDSMFDLRTSTIEVPERDQVYQPSEEELRGYLDPYENVLCTECLQGGDDALMLLCDICDSPTHTYCVGLGYDVPEGNWYCDGCRPTALDSLNSQGLNPTPDERVNTNFPVGSSPMANVRESFDLNEAYVPDTPLTNGNEQPSPRLSVGDFPAPSPASGSGALTVRERRRIQHQIRHIFSTRRQQDSETNGTTPSVSAGRLLGTQVSRPGVLEPQLTEIPQRSIPSPGFPFHGRLEVNTRPTWQNGDAFITRLTPVQGIAIQRQASTSNEGSCGSFLQNEFAGSNSTFGSPLGPQQVQIHSSGLNIEPDVNASPQPWREGSLSSRRFRGSQDMPF